MVWRAWVRTRPGTLSQSARRRLACRRVPGAAVVTAACAAVSVASLALPATLAFDPWAWLVWGREVAHLDLDTTGGPSWKPLPVMATTVLAAGGDLAPTLWLVVARTAGLAALVVAYRLAARFAGPAAGAVAAGQEDFVSFAVVLEGQRPLSSYSVVLSPTISDAEWNDRIALNAFLLGNDRATFEAAQRSELAGLFWGAAARDPTARQKLLQDRVRSYDATAADLPATLARYGVRYVALPSGRAPPAYLASGWQRLQRGRFVRSRGLGTS